MSLLDHFLRVVTWLAVIVSQLVFFNSNAIAEDKAASQSKLILVHYMPWYTANSDAKQWGWHWTMNHFDPNKSTDNRREIASHYFPSIGPYDSGDANVLEYHLLLMKIAGIDGVIVDWYGLQDHFDYATLHQNTQRLVEATQRYKLKFAICYEDQTINALQQADKVKAEGRVAHAVSELQWLADHWFQHENYVKLDAKPVLLSFGHAGLNDAEWKTCLETLKSPVAYFSEHYRREGASGGFDWPIPDQGLSGVEAFTNASKTWTTSIPTAFPRFVDIYAKAGVNPGYKVIDDNQGKTFRVTLEKALQSKSPLIQIATWNDWGEGTQIEPSIEFGQRDLAVLQEMRRTHVDAKFGYTAEDISIPQQLYEKRLANLPSQKLDQVAALIVSGDTAKAKKLLQEVQ